MKTLFFGIFLLLLSLKGNCQASLGEEKNSFPKNAIYFENTLFLINAVKYDRNIFIKNNIKLNAGIGVGSTLPLFLPYNISIPADVTVLIGSVHHLEMGVHLAPTLWFSKNHKSADFFDGGEIYSENTTSIPLYFRLGYRYQKAEGLFFKANIGPPLVDLSKNDQGFFNFPYVTNSEKFRGVDEGVRPLILLWPSVGVGYSF